MEQRNFEEGAFIPRFFSFVEAATARAGLRCAAEGLARAAADCSRALSRGPSSQVAALAGAQACLGLAWLRGLWLARPSACAAAGLLLSAMAGSALPWVAGGLHSPSWDGRWLVRAESLSRCQSKSGAMAGGCGISVEAGRAYMERALGSEAAGRAEEALALGAKPPAPDPGCLIAAAGARLPPGWAGAESSVEWGSGPAPWLAAALRPVPGAWRLGYRASGSSLCPGQIDAFWREGDWQAWGLCASFALALGMLIGMLAGELLVSVSSSGAKASDLSALEASEIASEASPPRARGSQRGGRL